MTYCVGMHLERGLLFMADTRTNAGVDNVSVFRKLFSWEIPGERAIVITTAGNLATTQSVISILDEQVRSGEGQPSIMNAPSMFRAAALVGATLRDIIGKNEASGAEGVSAFEASMIVGGQIAGERPSIFMVYPEGNFVEASEDTPFFQLGETKYGKPILSRAYSPSLSFEDAVKLLLVSFDSTIKSNLSVGLPLDLQVIDADTSRLGHRRRIDADDPFYVTISQGWAKAIKLAFDSLPDFRFDPD